MAPAVNPSASGSEFRDPVKLLWCSIRNGNSAGIAFEISPVSPVVPLRDRSEDITRVALEHQGWREPDDSFAFPIIAGAKLALRERDLVLSVPGEAEPFLFALDEPLDKDWLRLARSSGRVIVLYGCGTGARIQAALRGGQVVGSTARFSDQAREPSRRRHTRNH